MARGRFANELPVVTDPADTDGVLLGQGNLIKRQPFSDFLDRVSERLPDILELGAEGVREAIDVPSNVQAMLKATYDPNAVAGDVFSSANHATYTRAELLAISIPAIVDAIHTTGYALPGDGGGALYKRVGSEPSHAGKFQSADGAWWELANVIQVDPRQLGVVMDGTSATPTDNSQAWQDTLDFVKARRIQIAFTGAFAITQPGVLVGYIPSIRGACGRDTRIIGLDCSILDLDNDAVAGTRQTWSWFGVSFETDQPGTRTAIRFTGTTGVGFNRQAMVSTCNFLGYASGQCWQYGVDATKGSECVFQHCAFIGVQSNRELMQAAIRLTRGNHVSILDSTVLGAKFAVLGIKGGVPEGSPEGIIVQRNHFLVCDYGVFTEDHGGNYFDITHNHFSTLRGAVHLGRSTGAAEGAGNFSFVADNFFLVAGGDDYTEDHELIRINASRVQVHNNICAIAGAVHTGRVYKGVVLGATSLGCIVAENHLYRLDVGIEVKAGGLANQLLDNVYEATTTKVVDAGTGTIRREASSGQTSIGGDPAGGARLRVSTLGSGADQGFTIVNPATGRELRFSISGLNTIIADNAGNTILAQLDTGVLYIGGNSLGTAKIIVKATGPVNIKNLAAPPATGNSTGDIYYDTALSRLRINIGGVWRNLALEP